MLRSAPFILLLFTHKFLWNSRFKAFGVGVAERPKLKKKCILSKMATMVPITKSISRASRSCPVVERVTLNCCDDVTDAEFFDLLTINPLARCEALCLLGAALLTEQAARCAMTCMDG
jgi:hypothetical protein